MPRTVTKTRALYIAARLSMLTRMALGYAVAIGTGMGAAFAASMGSAGYALGLGVAVLSFIALPALWRRINSGR
jgi:hypothetical protein